jgi:hypothetical protein
MPLPTINDVQAVDPVLTNMLVGYRQKDARFVSREVFPSVPVDKDSGTYYIFTKSYWMRNEMLKRAPGGNFPRADFGVSTDTFATVPFGLEHSLPKEIQANSQIPMDLQQAGAQYLAQQSALNRELAFAALAMVYTAWTSYSSPTDWDDFSLGDPVTDVLTARSAISALTGQLPNTMVVGELVNDALINHPDIVDRVKHVALAGITNIEPALASVLGVEKYAVARGIYTASQEGATITYTRIIDDDALLCVVNSGAGIFDATCGKCFSWAGGGGDGEVVPYWDQKVKSSILQLSEQWVHKVVAADLGYFWADIV